MKNVGTTGGELSVEERNLLSVAYKNAVGSRRAAWRIIKSVEDKENSKGNADQKGYATEYRAKVEAELQEICDRIITLLDGSLISGASSGESKVFYQKMKADYFRYIAEFTEGAKKRHCLEQCEVGIRRSSQGGRERFEGDPSHPSWLGIEFLGLPVRGVG